MVFQKQVTSVLQSTHQVMIRMFFWFQKKCPEVSLGSQNVLRDPGISNEEDLHGSVMMFLYSLWAASVPSNKKLRFYFQGSGFVFNCIHVLCMHRIVYALSYFLISKPRQNLFYTLQIFYKIFPFNIYKFREIFRFIGWTDFWIRLKIKRVIHMLLGQNFSWKLMYK